MVIWDVGIGGARAGWTRVVVLVAPAIALPRVSLCPSVEVPMASDIVDTRPTPSGILDKVKELE